MIFLVVAAFTPLQLQKCVKSSRYLISHVCVDFRTHCSAWMLISHFILLSLTVLIGFCLISAATLSLLLLILLSLPSFFLFLNDASLCSAPVGRGASGEHMRCIPEDYGGALPSTDQHALLRLTRSSKCREALRQVQSFQRKAGSKTKPSAFCLCLKRGVQSEK